MCRSAKEVDVKKACVLAVQPEAGPASSCTALWHPNAACASMHTVGLCLPGLVIPLQQDIVWLYCAATIFKSRHCSAQRLCQNVFDRVPTLWCRFRNLALKYHPAKGGAEAEAAEYARICEAYDVLSDRTSSCTEN